ncbi:OLC1v1002144C1 [Oldenlandia corymbosa var. corymbosa]|uniref:OLC1v1002144C1 n=1 Tax=Oldenlandia corymbosa var. corymbosa TaxID=529605 RepID=A0AAV1D6X6_OLDCO|nr:OLC1v1002144C1 [Oldenlandia corymbosa var. corymbosa]
MMLLLPDELVLEILKRLSSGKQVGRCKCVCKSWRSILASPTFLEAYQRRQPGLVLYFPEEIDSETGNDRKDMRIRFFYSTLWLHNPKEEFSCLYQLEIGSRFDQITNVVNGLTCVCEGNPQAQRWTLHNICTGQKMSLPAPPPMNPLTLSTCHLGYDPGSKVYKLLRLRWITNNVFNHPRTVRPNAEIMTLGSSSTRLSNSWRNLDKNESGIADLPLVSVFLIQGITFSGDGVLYWLQHRHLISFDLNKEKFLVIKLLEDLVCNDCRMGVVWRLAESMGRLVVWRPHRVVDHRIPERFVLFILEDKEGNKWSKHSVKLPEELTREPGSNIIVVGKLPTGEMLLMNSVRENELPRSRRVFSYNYLTNEFNGFSIGKLQIGPSGYGDDFSHDPGPFCIRFHDIMSWCLPDNNNLHLPLEGILSGRI